SVLPSFTNRKRTGGPVRANSRKASGRSRWVSLKQGTTSPIRAAPAGGLPGLAAPHGPPAGPAGPPPTRPPPLGLVARSAPRPWLSSSSHAVVLPVPLDEAGDPHLHRGPRPVAEVPRQVVDVGQGGDHVARLERRRLSHGAATQARFEHVDVALEV